MEATNANLSLAERAARPALLTARRPFLPFAAEELFAVELLFAAVVLVVFFVLCGCAVVELPVCPPAKALSVTQLSETAKSAQQRQLRNKTCPTRARQGEFSEKCPIPTL